MTEQLTVLWSVKATNSAKGSKVIADFSITPLGHGETSIGRYIAAAIASMNGVKGLKYEITPYGNSYGGG